MDRKARMKRNNRLIIGLVMSILIILYEPATNLAAYLVYSVASMVNGGIMTLFQG